MVSEIWVQGVGQAGGYHLELDKLKLKLELVLQGRWGALRRRCTFYEDSSSCCVKNGPWRRKCRNKQVIRGITGQGTVSGYILKMASTDFSDGLATGSMRNIEVKRNSKILAWESGRMALSH